MNKTKGVKKQCGVIVFGNGLNLREWLQDAVTRGFEIVFRKGYAELYKS